MHEFPEASDPTVNPPVAANPVKHGNITKIRIRRPRNQFIIYRQWMSGKIHAENPGMTAACICEFHRPWVESIADTR